MSEESTYKLTILSEFSKLTPDGRRPYVVAQCQCGTVFSAMRKFVLNGNTTSCGCRRKNTLRALRRTHGESVNGRFSKELAAYYGMKKRCTNPNEKSFPLYGGRGIEFRFTSFNEFLSDVGRVPAESYSIDRIDVNGHYEVGNVRWATIQEQSLNKRNTAIVEIDGVTRHVRDWCRIWGIEIHNYYNRKRLGWSVKQIFNIERRRA